MGERIREKGCKMRCEEEEEEEVDGRTERG